MASLADKYINKQMGKKKKPKDLYGGGRWASGTQNKPYESENTKAMRMAKEGEYKTEEGASAGLRLRLAWQPDPEVKEELLSKAIGKENWKRNQDGAFVVRENAENGWVLMDERGLSWADLADIAGSAPEVVGGFAGYALGTALAWNPAGWALLGLSFLSALGSQFFGAGAEELSRRIEGVERSATILDRRIPAVALETGLGTVTGGVVNTVKKVLGVGAAPFAKYANNFDNLKVQAAADMFEKETGIKLVRNAAEVTMAPLLQRWRGIASKVPGSSSVIEVTEREADEVIRQWQKYIAGEPLEGGELGKEIAKTINKQRTALLGRADDARKSVDTKIGAGYKSVQRIISPKEQSIEEGFNAAITGANKARDGFRETVGRMYQKVRDIIGDESFVSTTSQKNQIKKIISKMPKDEAVDDMPEQMAGAFVTPELKKFLLGYGNLAKKQTLDATLQMRRMVNDAITSGEGLPGVSTYHLRKLATAITRDLKRSTAKHKNKDVKKFLGEASDYYAKNNEKFKMPGVVEIFGDATEKGTATASKVMAKLVDGGGDIDFARNLKKVLAPKEWDQVRRAVMDNMMEGSKSVKMPGFMSPTAMTNYLDDMPEEMQKIIFGKNVNKLVRTLRTAAARFDQLTLDEALFNPDSLMTPRYGLIGGLKRAMEMEARAQADYENLVIKPFLKNNLGEAGILPEEFIRHMMKNGDKDLIKKSMALFSPELQEKIRQKTIQHVFEDSSRNPTYVDKIRFLWKEGAGNILDTPAPQKKGPWFWRRKPKVSGPLKPLEISSESTGYVHDFAEPILSGTKLQQNLQKGYGADVKSSVARLESLIGKDSMDKLRSLGLVQAAREESTEAAESAGGLIAGSVIANIAGGGIRGLTSVAKWRFITQMMESPLGFKWLTSQMTMPELHGLTKAAVLGAGNYTRLQKEFARDPDSLNHIFAKLGLSPTNAELDPNSPNLGDDYVTRMLDDETLPATADDPITGEGDQAAPAPPPLGPAPAASPPTPPAAPTPQQQSSADRAIGANLLGKNPTPRMQEIFKSIQRSSVGQ